MKPLVVVVSAYLYLTIASLAAPHAYADDSRAALDAKAYQLYQQVLSPFCPGRSLNDCPSSKAQELKGQMRQKMEQGVPDQVILDEVFASFGDQYRAVPHYAGFGKLVWWAPIAFILLGACLIALLASRKKRRVVAEEARSQNTLSEEMRATIRRELEALDD
jgi:cytochrome c-type biogenesis protein CcmH/NrfF